MKAYKVHDNLGAVIVYAETTAEARVLGRRELSGSFVTMRCKRVPELDNLEHEETAIHADYCNA